MARKAKEFDQPAPGGLLDNGFGRRAGCQRGILVPRRHEPVHRQRCGVRTPDHPSEEASSGAPGESAFGAGDELVDDGFGIGRCLGEGAVEAFPQLFQRAACGDGAVVEPAKPVDGVVGGGAQGGFSGGGQWDRGLGVGVVRHEERWLRGR